MDGIEPEIQKSEVAAAEADPTTYTDSSEFEPVTLKFSAKRVTVVTAPYSWCCGFHKDFISRPGMPSRACLDVVDRKIYVILGKEGAAFGKNAGNFRWANFSRLWIGRFGSPKSNMLALQMDGLFDKKKRRIEINPRQYTEQMIAALTPDPAQQSIEELERNDTFKTRPKLPGKNVAVKKETSKEITAPQRFPHSLPPKVAWSDDNIRNLKLLILDLQSNRPDIVFQIVNGIVVMRKQLFEEI